MARNSHKMDRQEEFAISVSMFKVSTASSSLEVKVLYPLCSKQVERFDDSKGQVTDGSGQKSAVRHQLCRKGISAKW